MSEPPASERPRAVLVGVQFPRVSEGEQRSSLDELARLAETLGFDVIGRVTQRRKSLAAGVVLGEGKLKELAKWTGGTGLVPVFTKTTGKKRGTDDGDTEGKGGEAEEAAVGVPLVGAGEATATAPVEGEVVADGEPADGEAADAADAEDEPAAAATGPAPGAKLATTVIVDHDLSPTQQRSLEKATGAEVLDRTSVILAIFHRHARTREARMQVEIARLSYLAPRLREGGGGGDRQRGGVGGRGAGESTMELDRRKIRDRIAELKRELAAVEHSAQTRRAGRDEVATVALVGYTNAGKSSLMRALTGSEIYVADKLFATLDTTVRALQPRTTPPILVSDTVGFIKKLPHDLVASFRSTLEEARDADLLLHVVDAADDAWRAHLGVTNEVLAEIGCGDVPTLLLLNKEDRLDDAGRAAFASEFPDAVLMSAHRAADVAALHDRIVTTFHGAPEEADLVVPWDRQRMVRDIHESCQVLVEDWQDDGAHLRVRAPARALERLRRQLAQGVRGAPSAEGA